MNLDGVRIEGDWLCACEDRPDFVLTLSILADGVVRNCPTANILIASLPFRDARAWAGKLDIPWITLPAKRAARICAALANHPALRGLPCRGFSAVRGLIGRRPRKEVPGK